MSGFDFDVFVSHASEDKDSFVRPLVEALTGEALTVWYDETELVPGCSLVETIERGLARSRFGVLILSHAFFGKRWPRKELNALTARAMATGESVLLPVWLGVSEADVRGYAPLLADVFAIRGDRGVDYTASRIRSVIRPERSPVAIAREILSRDFGVATPPPGDPWWLDAIESAAEDGVEGTFQHSMAFGRWSFPLPPPSRDPEERAGRLAQAVMRNAWVEEAERRPITPITPPDIVHEFIAADVMLRGLGADEEARGDLGIRAAFAEQPQHLALSLAELALAALTAPHLDAERPEEGSGSVGLARRSESIELVVRSLADVDRDLRRLLRERAGQLEARPCSFQPLTQPGEEVDRSLQQLWPGGITGRCRDSPLAERAERLDALASRDLRERL